MKILSEPRLHAALLAFAIAAGLGSGYMWNADWFDEFSHFTSEYLLPLFFFAIGLELRSEFTSGYFSDRRNIAAPAIAALFGVITPAALFMFASGQTSGSWAIPTATDITLGIALLSMVSVRISSKIRARFLALATIDDVIGLVILLTVFSSAIEPVRLSLLVGLLILYIAFQKLPNLPSWLSILIFCLAIVVEVGAGIQTSLIGFVFGFVSRDNGSPEKLAEINGLLVLPLFGFGIGAVSGGVLATGIAAVVFASLLLRPIGKCLGIIGGALFARLLFKTGDDLRSWIQVGLLGGLGLTVSLLIAQIVYENDEASLAAAVLGTLVASVISATLFLLVTRLQRQERPNEK